MTKSIYIKSILIAIASISIITAFDNSVFAREERGGVRRGNIERSNVAPRHMPERGLPNHGAAAVPLRGAETNRAYEAGAIGGAAVSGVPANGGTVVDPSLIQPQQPTVNVNVQPAPR